MRDNGPLVYEDPNKSGPKDRYILVRVNAFEQQAVHPDILVEYVNHTLKDPNNKSVLKEIQMKHKRKSTSEQTPVQTYIDGLNHCLVKLSGKWKKG